MLLFVWAEKLTLFPITLQYPLNYTNVLELQLVYSLFGRSYYFELTIDCIET
jgi:hypothetical protein